VVQPKGNHKQKKKNHITLRQGSLLMKNLSQKLINQEPIPVWGYFLNLDCVINKRKTLDI